MNTTSQPECSRKDFLTPINDQFLKAFATGQLIIDCPQIEVRQLATHKPQVYRGRGMLSLLAGEEFQLRMYVDDDSGAEVHPFQELMRMTHWVPGEVIPPDEYYEFSATDISGFTWTCAKLQVKLHGSRNGIVITGRLFDILRHTAVGLTAPLPSIVSMYFFDDLRVPYTEFVSTQTTLGERKLSTQLSPLFAKFDAVDFHFEVQKAEPNKGSTILRITSKDNSWPEAIETRVEEALRYVTLSPVRWCIVEKRIGDTRQVAVAPRISREGSLFDEPIDHRRSEYADNFWQLFVAYFLHVVAHPDADNYHPLSAQLFHVISAETHQLDLVGLLVSVAVEGVLNSEYSSLAKPSDVFLVRLDQVAKVIRRLKCADEGLARRLAGVLSPMRSSRPKDKLKILEANGVITKDMVEAWGKLRNATAHAAVHLDPDKVHEMFARCHTVYTMLNRLVFQAIGYSGKYQDFSVRSWPIVDFKTVALKLSSSSSGSATG